MKANSNCPITENQLKKYEAFFDRIKAQMDKSKLPDLYCVLLQSSYGLEENKDTLSSSDLLRFSAEIMSKIINEGWAIIGCYERAAFLASFHHTRAALELIACYHWSTYKTNKIEKRIKKYFEFKELFLYQLYLKYNESPEKDLIPSLNDFTEEDIIAWKKKEPEWIKLFKPTDNNLLNVKYWHYNTLIDHMLEEFPNKKLKLFYEEFSHATHFSPFSHLLGTDDTIIGLPINLDGDISEINRPITIYLDSLEFVLSNLEGATKVNIEVKFPRYQVEQ